MTKQFLGSWKIMAALVGLVSLVAACVPIREGENTVGPGDDPVVRALADELALPGNSSQNLVSVNKIECDKLGGDYSRQGLAGFYMCVLAYSDAGKICTAKSDCHGSCIAGQGANNRGTSPGKCQANTIPFGCYATIGDNGKVGGTLCRD